MEFGPIKAQGISWLWWNQMHRHFHLWWKSLPRHPIAFHEPSLSLGRQDPRISSDCEHNSHGRSYWRKCPCQCPDGTALIRGPIMSSPEPSGFHTLPAGQISMPEAASSMWMSLQIYYPYTSWQSSRNPLSGGIGISEWKYTLLSFCYRVLLFIIINAKVAKKYAECYFQYNIISMSTSYRHYFSEHLGH